MAATTARKAAATKTKKAGVAKSKTAAASKSKNVGANTKAGRRAEEPIDISDREVSSHYGSDKEEEDGEEGEDE